MEEIQNINEGSSSSFEDFKNENGITFWWASDLMVMLGYKDMKSFQKVLDRATKAFVSLNIPHYENIISQQREIEGHNCQDFKLSRFACYIAVMNGDPKKVQVAEAQVYFAQQTRKFELHIENNDDIERMLIREELTEGNKSLASIAKQSGVIDYAKFQNAGYLGMYNMESWRLEKKRDVKKGSLMEHMGRTELAANLFRVTQTEERIKNKGIRGQTNLEQTHYDVGKEVRGIIQKNMGKNPESLPQEKKIAEVKKELKDGHKKMLKEDNNKKKK
ncbi:DNA-damage-inducible protein [Flavobacterium psychrophilum]|uniref:BRO family protein n=1 Tax=Flavobacterium psychrophilum TaxID=96345 RepID=UPI000B7C1D8B|nr:BRO family protein [Flavobacterium psychrophilum]MBF2091872.1 damage-inducible protein [Flavobacterium psychrophilum]SNB05401.1 DNA-damage-inducible protein [Flavobacterium psychrophilum]GEJ29553.1 DNA damage-inducible protein D [Flavobacterium psychrophilum]GEJ33819.1 DNA damage-inducible protein D [Flavobacterium psychrophilum]GEJ38058.1 DNA damage-inducible protein D [Flavobacterium psychrophilum]